VTFLKRIVTLATLAGFLGLAAADFTHHHSELTAKPEASCVVCKITHQTPALTSETTGVTPALDLVFVVSEPATPLYLSFASTHHGLSPPIAL